MAAAAALHQACRQFMADPTDTPTTENAPAEEAAPAPTFLARLLALLGLEETADEAAVEARITELLGNVTTSAGTVESIQAELDKIRAEYDALHQKQEELHRQQREAEVDAILEQFADRLTDEKAKTRIRGILLSDRESGIDILNGMAIPAPAAPPEEAPTPMHDPAGDAAPSGPSEDEIARLARTLWTSKKAASWDEAMRLATKQLSNS
jgi:uncharacterized protein (DUF2267 family)